MAPGWGALPPIAAPASIENRYTGGFARRHAGRWRRSSRGAVGTRFEDVLPRLRDRSGGVLKVQVFRAGEGALDRGDLALRDVGVALLGVGGARAGGAA